MMRVFDSHPAIRFWASEAIAIPYQDPNTGRWRSYTPDFLVQYVDEKGSLHAEVIEVKPSRQAYEHATKSRRDRAILALNLAKWRSAVEFCKNHHMNFRIMTEHEIYRSPSMR